MKAIAILVVAALTTGISTSSGYSADEQKVKTKKNSELIVGKWSPTSVGEKAPTIGVAKELLKG